MKKKHLILAMILFPIFSTVLNGGDLRYVNKVSIGITYSLYVDNEFAYVTNNDGLSIISIQDPNNPVLVGNLKVGTSFGIAVENDMAYISANTEIIAADIIELQNIKIVDRYNIGAVTRRLSLKDHYLFVTSDLGLDIFDISNSQKFKHLSHFEHNKLRAVGISNATAYLASYNKGIEVVDISNPTIPEHISYLDSTIGAWDIHTYEKYLYIGRHGAGISIFNIVDANSPKYISTYCDDDNGEAQGVWGNGHNLFIADNYGIEVLNIADPLKPFEVANYMDVSAAHDIYVNNGFIYSATGSKSFLILKYN